ncbi:MAG: hypothetical protein OEV40_10835, partial [Acidimicrobiia bacterium]|nr:hypothetical protein [Acidimicrobiia bacterium]
GEIVHVRRYLLVANQTLVSQALHELVDERVAAGPAEFHILAPQSTRSATAQILGRAPGPFHSLRRYDRDADRQEAEERLRLFRHAFARLGDALTGEVGGPDPVAAVRKVLERGSFDEIIVSMLPPKRSRWPRGEVIADLQRSVPVPVTALIHDEGDDLASCPIG